MLQQRDIYTCLQRFARGDKDPDLGANSIQQFQTFKFIGAAAGLEIRRGTLRQLSAQLFPIVLAPSLQNIGGADCGPGHCQLRNGLLSNISSVRQHLFLDNIRQKVLQQ